MLPLCIGFGKFAVLLDMQYYSLYDCQYGMVDIDGQSQNVMIFQIGTLLEFLAWSNSLSCFCNREVCQVEYHGASHASFKMLTQSFMQALIKSTNRLRDSLLSKDEPKLAVPLLLLIAQHRSV